MLAAAALPRRSSPCALCCSSSPKKNTRHTTWSCPKRKVTPCLLLRVALSARHFAKIFNNRRQQSNKTNQTNTTRSMSEGETKVLDLSRVRWSLDECGSRPPSPPLSLPLCFCPWIYLLFCLSVFSKSRCLVSFLICCVGSCTLLLLFFFFFFLFFLLPSSHPLSA